jgi:hypothetical protein
MGLSSHYRIAKNRKYCHRCFTDDSYAKTEDGKVLWLKTEDKRVLCAYCYNLYSVRNP